VHTDHFDDRAATWDDDPAKLERAKRAADAVADVVGLDSSTRLLEYGAGTGLAAQALVGRVGAITLADPSEGMREVMQRKVEDGTFPAGTRVWDLDLVTDDVPDDRFDVAIALMSLHHVGTPDLATVLDGLATLLTPGGRLCVIDLEEDADGAFHQHLDDFEGFHGFRHADLTGRLESAGFTDVDISPCGTMEKDGEEFALFLAVATAPRS
jgi:ubiquinone/menaquinone biosynthesis C-methylase UbiE